MEYKGKLYGKVGNSFFPLEATTEDFERYKALYLEGNKMLREVSVRCQLIFPETEEEAEWFEEGTEKSGDLLIRLYEHLTKHNDLTPNN